MSAIIDSCSIIHHSFANDLQSQMPDPSDGISELLHSMQSCISDVNARATANMLRLNDNKTKLMLVKRVIDNTNNALVIIIYNVTTR